MDQVKIGAFIRTLRKKHGLTQLALAERIYVSDKAISKWERGCGLPELSQLRILAEQLGVSVDVLLQGELGENEMSNGNFRQMKFYVCPDCGNLIYSSADSEIYCCGKRLEKLEAQKASGEMEASLSDGQWYLTSEHEMQKSHYISFVAFLTSDTLYVKKLYPEWNLSVRFPFGGHGTLLWYCSTHGLFYQHI